MAPQVASLVPAATQVLAVTVEHLGVPPEQSPSTVHATQAPPAYLGVAAEMAAQVVSSVPAATHALETVDHAGVAAEMAAHVASLVPAATQVLAVTVEHLGVPPEQSLS